MVADEIGPTSGQLRVTSLERDDGWDDGREYVLTEERPCAVTARACSPESFTVELSYQRSGEIWKMISSRVERSGG